VKGRDVLSAMTIGPFGLATRLFDAVFPKRMSLLSLLQTKIGLLSMTVILLER
jgi:hypothetical protein